MKDLIDPDDLRAVSIGKRGRRGHAWTTYQALQAAADTIEALTAERAEAVALLREAVESWAMGDLPARVRFDDRARAFLARLEHPPASSPP